MNERRRKTGAVPVLLPPAFYPREALDLAQSKKGYGPFLMDLVEPKRGRTPFSDINTSPFRDEERVCDTGTRSQ